MAQPLSSRGGGTPDDDAASTIVTDGWVDHDDDPELGGLFSRPQQGGGLAGIDSDPSAAASPAAAPATPMSHGGFAGIGGDP